MPPNRFSQAHEIIDVESRLIGEAPATEAAPIKKPAAKRKAPATKKSAAAKPEIKESPGVDSPRHQGKNSAELENPPAADLGVAAFVISKPKRKGTQFHKPTPLVHHKPQQVMSVTQQKMTNIFLRNAQMSTQNSEGMWSIPLPEVLKLLGTTSRNNKHVTKTLDEMLGIKVRWNVLEDGKIVQNFAVVFTFAQLSSKHVRYKLEEQAIKFLSGNFPYANIDLIEQRDLSKACSVPLYEFTSRYKGIGATRWLPWEELRDMLVSAENIPANAMKWGSFNERYLQPAIKDVNANTKLYLQLQTEVVGRSVKTVRFVVDRTKNALEDSASALNAPQKNTLTTALAALGVTERVMRNLLKNYSEQEIQGAIEHTQRRINAPNLKPLRAPSRYLQESLKEGYYREASASGQESLFPESSTTQNTGDVPKNNPRALVESLVQKQRIMDVKVILAEIGEGDMTALMDEYNETVSLPALRIKKGRNKAGVMPAFQSWYAKKLWGDIDDAEIARMLERKLSGK